jgi:hypothetical protein
VATSGGFTIGNVFVSDVLRLEEVNGHLGQNRVATVYGVLRKPQDTVTARTSAGPIKVHRVTLPARLPRDALDAHDVLIYMVVKAHAGRTPVTVTAYAANGTIESRTHYHAPPPNAESSIELLG